MDPANATNKAVVWMSSNISVATVDANGNVTAVGAGSTSIMVRKPGVGKTVVTAGLTAVLRKHGIKAMAVKPVQSGGLERASLVLKKYYV